LSKLREDEAAPEGHHSEPHYPSSHTYKLGRQHLLTQVGPGRDQLGCSAPTGAPGALPGPRGTSTKLPTHVGLKQGLPPLLHRASRGCPLRPQRISGLDAPALLRITRGIAFCSARHRARNRWTRRSRACLSAGVGHSSRHLGPGLYPHKIQSRSARGRSPMQDASAQSTRCSVHCLLLVRAQHLPV